MTIKIKYDHENKCYFVFRYLFGFIRYTTILNYDGSAHSFDTLEDAERAIPKFVKTKLKKQTVVKTITI